MDAEEKSLFRGAVDAVLRKSAAPDVVPTLLAEGWAEVRADDEAFAIGVLFERGGELLTAAPLLDLALVDLALAGDGPGEVSRPLLPIPGHDAAAEIRDGEVLVTALAIGGPADSYLAGIRLANGGDALVRLDGTGLRAAAAGGFDPELGVSIVRGTAAVPAISPAATPGWPAPRALLRRCLAHELVGTAEALAALLREHVATRAQFGRPLGTWQTVQHRLADIHVEIAAARSALEAAWRDRRELASSVAKCQAATAALATAAHSQQIFGAIGFTAEQGLHRYVRRCFLLDALLGARDELAGEIGRCLLATPDLEAIDAGF